MVVKNYQLTWNFSPFFYSDNDPQIEKNTKLLEEAAQNFINTWQDRDDYLKNPRYLKKALDEYEKLMRFFRHGGDVGFYFWLRSEQDQSDPQIKAKLNKFEDIYNKISSDLQFFELRIAKISSKLQKQILENTRLAEYHHFLERLFAEAKYQLTEPEEKILTLKSPVSYSNWVRMTQSFITKEEREVLTEDGKKEVKSFSEIINLMSSKNKKVRDASAAAFNEIMSKFADVAENELNSVLQNKKIDDDLRKVTRPDLIRHLADDIDSEIVDTLVDTTVSRFDISQRYYALKAKLLGLKRLAYHERNVEYGQIDLKYPWEKSVKLVEESFNKLNRTFAVIFRQFIDKGQIDVFPKKGRAGGAFCANGPMDKPTYILLNHTDRLDNVTTIAHEMGHGINAELMKKTQNSLNFGTPLSTAEVASVFMEDFILQELLKQADEEARLSIMVMKLNDDISTIFRQIACYRFERELHQMFREEGYLSGKDIGRLFQKHMSSYMGKAVIQSSGSENWWIYWSHIRNFFYNYSYANGSLIAKALHTSVKKDPKFVKKVEKFLSAGLSDSPKNIFKNLGIDISDKAFWNKGLNEVENLLNETEKLAKKLGKIS